jgi:hypothetical protein
MEIIESLIKKGFSVFYITKKDSTGAEKIVALTATKNIDKKDPKIIHDEHPGKEEFIERIQKRAKRKRNPLTVHWQVQNKIKEMKEDGMTSKAVAEELNLTLDQVNKYWV